MSRAPEPGRALLTDLYELTMLEAYWREGMQDEAVFSLHFRELPETRNYVVACGLASALEVLEDLRFSETDLEALERVAPFSSAFLDWLGGFRFSGDVYAVPEGTPVFPEEPLLEVVAPIAEAQLAESLVMNQVHLQTVLASKASRLVAAAEGRRVVDFGLRRMHGADAALQGARAFYVAGVDATSNVLAGVVHGIPVTGTMAHSYVQAHESEEAAFRAFSEAFPETVLLVDTYDTLEGVHKVVALARERGDDFRVRGVRIDSGDLGGLAREARRILDEAGLSDVVVVVSGSLDEHAIADLVGSGAPIAGFGVGTRLGVSADAPYLDLAYKLTDYAGRGRLKTSPGKRILPGRKQVFRVEEDGEAVRDVIARDGEDLSGRPLLAPVMQGGKKLAVPGAAEAREHARAERERLPPRVRALAPADPPYPVEISRALEDHARAVRERVAG